MACPKPTATQVGMALVVAALLHIVAWLWIGTKTAEHVLLPVTASTGGALRLALGSSALSNGAQALPTELIQKLASPPNEPDVAAVISGVESRPIEILEPEPSRPVAPRREAPATQPRAAGVATVPVTMASAGADTTGAVGKTGTLGGVADTTAAWARQRYLVELANWLGRHKRYPRQARSRGIEGIVSISFTLDKNGRLMAQKLNDSSGHAVLDRAAKVLLARAAPFPKPSWEVSNEFPLTVVVPIAYRLR